MAIVAMKRLTVLAPRERQELLLSRLQELGALHLVPLRPDAEIPTEISQRAAWVRRQRQILEQRQRGVATAAPPPTSEGLDVDDLLTRVERLGQQRAEYEARIIALEKEAQQARPFGMVTTEDFARLADQGLSCAVFLVPRGTVALEETPAVLRCPVRLHDGRDGLLLCGFGVLPGFDGERLDPPSRPLHAYEEELRETRARLAGIGDELMALTAQLPLVDRKLAELIDADAVVGARARAGGDEHLFAVQGWCPALRVKELGEAVLAMGGAMLVDEPSADDQPPILLKNNVVVTWFEPLLGAFQYPSYREPDPTLFFAPFMALFYGFCLGDAAYGLILFIAATWLRRKFRIEKGEMLKAFRLFQLLGLATVVVGLLIGVAFGVSLYEITALKNLGLTAENIPTFKLSQDPQNLFYFALALGVVQCSVGLFLRMWRQIRARDWQNLLGTLGWFGCIPGVAFWMVADQPALFYVALGLIVLFKNPVTSVVGRVGGGLWGLYEWVLGLFGDIMSYLRIFGLGLSSGIIAVVVNTIAAMMFSSGSVVGVAGGVLILLIGHSFNFAMSVLGSTVHSARLQFLEFFGKFFDGGGVLYEPLRRSKEGEA